MNDNLKQKMTSYALRTEEYFKKYFSSADSDYKIIADAQLYSLLAGGKRVRPFLVYEFASLFSSDSERETALNNAISLAAAIEMVHTFSLIHDDLPCMDNDVLRRGKNTCHVEFDEATALLAGDSLSIAAFEVIADSSLSPLQIKRSVKLLSSCAGWNGMIAGQIIDLAGEKTQLSYETLNKLHLLKTGKLIECACALGCIAANIDETDERYLDAISYASKIGLAFQIKDDILDKTSSTKELGKTVGKDAKSNKTTFLSFFSLEEADKTAKAITNEAMAIIGKYENTDDLIDFTHYLLERKN